MTEEQVEQWKQEKWTLKTNLDDALDLIDAYKKRVSELEAQIEKMKCCFNCSKWKDGQCADVPNDNSYYSADFVCEDWEIKEK